MAKAVSTWLFDTWNFVIRLLSFVLFGNPLSMWIINLLWPHDAAEFAKNRNIFGEDIYKFYQRRALKWPFHWARWWMQLEDLGKYSVEQQVKYFFNVAFKNEQEAEALKAMQQTKHGYFFWPDSFEELFNKYGKVYLPTEKICRQIRNRRETPWWYRRSVAEFMMKNVRLSYTALEKVVEWAKSSEDIRYSLKQYLASGKLNDSQFELLIAAAATDEHSGDFNMLGILLDYIKSYGISEAYMDKVRDSYPQPFYEQVSKASVLYLQTKELKAFRNNDEGRSAWRKFCKETKQILPEVQKKMSLDQYRIFRNCGCKLDIEALKYFLYGSDKAFWEAVFIKEKDTCRNNEEVRELIRSNPALELAYRDTLEGGSKIRK